MNQFRNEQLWQDPANWVFGVLYRAPGDSRWIVPMRYTNAAWSPNLAHSRAVLVAIGILVAALAPAVTLWLLGRLGDPLMTAGALLWFVVCNFPVGAVANHGRG